MQNVNALNAYVGVARAGMNSGELVTVVVMGNVANGSTGVYGVINNGKAANCRNGKRMWGSGIVRTPVRAVKSNECGKRVLTNPRNNAKTKTQNATSNEINGRVHGMARNTTEEKVNSRGIQWIGKINVRNPQRINSIACACNDNAGPRHAKQWSQRNGTCKTSTE